MPQKADMENIIEAIQRQVRRVREVLVPQYESLGPVGAFGKTMILRDAEEGDAAIASGDVVRMVAAYKALEDCE